MTSFISGILGMAGGMILMGVLLALLTVPQAMVLHGVTQLAANGWRAILWRTSIDWRVFCGNAYGSIAALAAFTRATRGEQALALLLLGVTPFVGLALPERLALDVEQRGHSLRSAASICTGLQLLAGVSGRSSTCSSSARRWTGARSWRPRPEQSLGT